MAPTETTATQSLRLTRRFPESRERIFRAWTEAEELKRWFRPTNDYVSHVIELDVRQGGGYTIEMRHKGGNVSRVSGRYVEIRAPERLVFTWKFDNQPEMPETSVTVELLEDGNGTELRLTHERFASEESRDRHVWGWTGSLDTLIRRFSTSIMQGLLAEFEQEATTTKRVLEAILADKITWRPHPKSMSLGQLGLHIAEVPGLLVLAQEEDSFAIRRLVVPQPESREQILRTFAEGMQAVRDRLPGIDDARATALWTATKDGRVVMQIPRMGFVRRVMLNHLFHHRGQLSVYLRLLDVPVPSIYGPSADEDPFE
jgi:uncharacterized protein YndB with AHSA1/START domain/uncharacterized damage-inducible protein DinB